MPTAVARWVAARPVREKKVNCRGVPLTLDVHGRLRKNEADGQEIPMTAAIITAEGLVKVHGGKVRAPAGFP
jgi:hypothetical protein